MTYMKGIESYLQRHPALCQHSLMYGLQLKIEQVTGVQLSEEEVKAFVAFSVSKDAWRLLLPRINLTHEPAGLLVRSWEGKMKLCL